MEYPQVNKRKSAKLLALAAALPAIMYVNQTPYNPEALGVYHTWRNEIYLRNDLARDFFYMNATTNLKEYVCAHEHGHWIYYKRLSKQHRNIYKLSFERTGYSPTKYGETNAAENFAEIYAGFDQKILEYDKNRYQHTTVLSSLQRFEQPNETCNK